MYYYSIIRLVFYSFILSSLSLVASANDKDSIIWNKIVQEQYTLHYSNADKNKIEGINESLQSGLNYVAGFFRHSFQTRFDVYIFSDRTSLDKQWQKDWGDTTFKSQCWMVASGVGHRLDLLSINAWQNEACDHNANDTIEIRQVIWHELTHVYHGQYNPDHTFNYIEKLDWLVEGIATLVSGQLNEKRLQRVKQMVKDGRAPTTLDDFWKGRDKYGLAGSMVSYIDRFYSRQKVFEILNLTSKKDVLKHLGISEDELITNWKDSFQ